MGINKAKPGNFCWFELATGGRFPVHALAERRLGIGGMMAIMEQWGQMPPHWSNYIQVANCDETAAKASSLGGKVCMPPTDIPNIGRFATLADPQGATFSVIALAPMHKG